MRMLAYVTLALLVLTSASALAKGPQPHPDIVQLTGLVTDVDAVQQQIVVNGVTVQVTPDTIIELRDVECSFDVLSIGMTVTVCGKLSDDLLVAHKITIMYQGK